MPQKMRCPIPARAHLGVQLCGMGHTQRVVAMDVAWVDGVRGRGDSLTPCRRGCTSDVAGAMLLRYLPTKMHVLMGHHQAH